MRCLACVVIGLLASMVMATGVSQIDLTEIDGDIVSVADGEIRILQGQESVTAEVADAWRVTLSDVAAVDLWRSVGTALATTMNGDVLAVTGAVLGESDVTLVTTLLGEKVVPLSRMASAYLPGPEQTANALTQEAELMGIDTGTTDRLLVQEATELLAVEGVLESISAAEGDEPAMLTFYWRDESRSLELSRVRAILLAPAADEADDDTSAEMVTGVLLARDGSRLVFTSVTVDDESVTFDSPTFGETFTLPRGQVVALEFVSDRLVHLSDIAPETATTEAQMIDPIAYRADEALEGGLLTLAGVSYDKGLAVHSETTLTWNLAGGYKTFVAIVGIDDSVRPGGSATLELICDGQTVATVTLMGRDDPQTLRCDLDGVQEFTIRVGFGPDGLEVSDHVDLAMARLITLE